MFVFFAAKVLQKNDMGKNFYIILEINAKNLRISEKKTTFAVDFGNRQPEESKNSDQQGKVTDR